MEGTLLQFIYVTNIYIFSYLPRFFKQKHNMITVSTHHNKKTTNPLIELKKNS